MQVGAYRVYITIQTAMHIPVGFTLPTVGGGSE